MKAKSLEIEAYTIAETTRKLGYKSSKTIYRLLNKTPSPLEEYIWYEYPNAIGRKRIYLMLEPPNCLTARSNEILVLVDGCSKIIIIILSLKG